MRRQVVLPDPEGPRKEKNSPERTARFTCATAVTEPNRLPTSINSTSIVVSSPTARDYTRARSGQGDARGRVRVLDIGWLEREYSKPSIRSDPDARDRPDGAPRDEAQGQQPARPGGDGVPGREADAPLRDGQHPARPGQGREHQAELRLALQRGRVPAAARPDRASR